MTCAGLIPVSSPKHFCLDEFAQTGCILHRSHKHYCLDIL